MKQYSEEELNLMDATLMYVYKYLEKQSRFNKNCVLYDCSPFSKDDCYVIHTALMYSCISDRTIYIYGGLIKYIIFCIIMRLKYKDKIKLRRTYLGSNISVRLVKEDIMKSGFSPNEMYKAFKKG